MEYEIVKWKIQNIVKISFRIDSKRTLLLCFPEHKSLYMLSSILLSDRNVHLAKSKSIVYSGFIFSLFCMMLFLWNFSESPFSLH